VTLVWTYALSGWGGGEGGCHQATGPLALTSEPASSHAECGAGVTALQQGVIAMMQVTGKVLAAQRFLNGMAADQLDELATTAAEVVFPVGYRVFAEGGYADKFWLIESGHVAVTVQVPGEGAAVIANVGIGGPLGWSWLTPSHKWAFSAVCVTEVKAYEFNVLAVRERCLADPALGDELTRRLFQVLAGRLQDIRAALVTRGEDASRYAAS